MQRPQAILFDLDGTLRDSLVEIHRGVEAVCVDERVPVPSFHEFRTTFTIPSNNYWLSIGVTKPHDEILDHWRSSCDIDASPLFDDVVHILERLKEEGVHMGVISGHLHELVVDYCDRERIIDYFETVAGSASSKVSLITDFFALRHIAPRRVWYVGDFISDMRDAKAAGVVGVGITRGTGCAETLKNAGAEWCIDGLDELVEA